MEKDNKSCKKDPLAKYTSKFLANQNSQYNKYKINVESLEDKRNRNENTISKGQDLIAHANSETSNFQDWKTWEKSQQKDNSSHLTPKERHSLLSKEQVRALIIKKEQTKKKYKNAWLFEK